mmetsp:Transcript_11656/g.16966  ORF Transcript_11656/g.16966 Transcript_11656/m.16966 type:complete len:586 (-) Transcript_11656:215-1972(-)
MSLREPRRYLFLADNTFPGPVIEADEGDTIHVKVTNSDPASSVTIHYHGIHQIGTPFSDGPVGLNQCAVGSYQSHEYVFMAYPAGTHYWHAHSSMYFADGLSGPIVIRPKDPDPFTYDDEIILFLQDWYIETGTAQLAGLNSWPFLWIGNPNSILINGKGIAPECLPGGVNYNNAKVCLETCQGSMLDLLETITVEAGKTYRLRIINSAQLVMQNIAITGHNLTIVQVEGTNTEPLTVESFDISPGQRVDVLFTANQDPGSYWIETTVRERNIQDVKGQAILQYAGSNATVPDTVPAHPAWDDTAFGEMQQDSLKSLDVSSDPESVALNATDIKRYVLVGTQNVYTKDDGESKLLRWAVNNVSSHRIGPRPLIERAVTASEEFGWPTAIPDTIDMTTEPPVVWNYTDLIGTDFGGPGPSLGTYSEAVVRLEEGDVVEFILQNTRALNGVAEFHPWHAHGYSFYIVGRGTGIFDPEKDVGTYNEVIPVLRDTVTLYPLNWVALRFVASNPGAWFFHCHLLSHQVMGMGFMVVTQPDMLPALDDNLLSCPDYLYEDFEGLAAPTSSASFLNHFPWMFSMSTLLALFF